MQQWEYKLLAFSNKELGQLTTLANEGWEMVGFQSVHDAPDKHEAYFKRPKQTTRHSEEHPMKASPISATQLIAELEAIIEEHGDLPVCVLARVHGVEEDAHSVYATTTAGEHMAVISSGGEPE